MKKSILKLMGLVFAGSMMVGAGITANAQEMEAVSESETVKETAYIQENASVQENETLEQDEYNDVIVEDNTVSEESYGEEDLSSDYMEDTEADYDDYTYEEAPESTYEEFGDDAEYEATQENAEEEEAYKTYEVVDEPEYRVAEDETENQEQEEVSEEAESVADDATLVKYNKELKALLPVRIDNRVIEDVNNPNAVTVAEQRDDDYQRAKNTLEVKDEDKSVLTKGLEEFDKLTNLGYLPTKAIHDEIDKMDSLGDAEKDLVKDLTKIGISSAAGTLTGEMLPGIGTCRKGLQAINCFSKALDSKNTLSSVYNVACGIEKTVDTIATVIPGGGYVVAAKDAVKSVATYAIRKLWSWF